MKSYSIVISLSDLFNSAHYPLGPPCCQEWQNYILIYHYIDDLYHMLFIHSSINGQLGCIHVLTTVNNAAMNVVVKVLLALIKLKNMLFQKPLHCEGHKTGNIFPISEKYYPMN